MIGGVLGVAYVGSNSSLASPVGHLPLCLRHRKLLKLQFRFLESLPPLHYRRNLDWNWNLKNSRQEKEETEKPNGDADPPGESVHVQAVTRVVGNSVTKWGCTCPNCDVSRSVLSRLEDLWCSHLRCPSRYSWLQPRGVTAACMAGPNTKPMVCKCDTSVTTGSTIFKSGNYVDQIELQLGPRVGGRGSMA